MIPNKQSATRDKRNILELKSSRYTLILNKTGRKYIYRFLLRKRNTTKSETISMGLKKIYLPLSSQIATDVNLVVGGHVTDDVLALAHLQNTLEICIYHQAH